jgi:hypothetical protein
VLKWHRRRYLRFAAVFLLGLNQGWRAAASINGETQRRAVTLKYRGR